MAAEWKPKQALCPHCTVIRGVVSFPAPPGKEQPEELLYFVEEHSWEPGAPRCRGSGLRVVRPHEVVFPQEMRAA